MRFLAFLVLLSACTASNKPTADFTIFSPEVKDSFVVKIRKPADFSSEKSYHHIYVADGSLKLGQYFLGSDSSWMADVPTNCVIITISHIGDWNEKRRRDFIPSDVGGYNNENFGKAKDFYLFLKHTLIPTITRQYENRLSSSFVGHSFSGLFCLYLLFQDDKLFDRHFAISPSVWAMKASYRR